MQLLRPQNQPLPWISIVLFTSLLAISNAAATKCIPVVPELTGDFVFPRAALPGYYAQTPTQQGPAAILQRLEAESKIRNKLTLYGLAIDGKNLTSLSDVFVPDAKIYFDDSVGLLDGLDGLVKLIQTATAKIDTQSLYGSEFIKVYEDSPCTASTLTYFETTYFGTGAAKGKVP